LKQRKPSRRLGCRQGRGSGVKQAASGNSENSQREFSAPASSSLVPTLRRDTMPARRSMVPEAACFTLKKEKINE